MTAKIMISGGKFKRNLKVLRDPGAGAGGEISGFGGSVS